MPAGNDRPVDLITLLKDEIAEWRLALSDILREHGAEGVQIILRDLQNHSLDQGIVVSEATLNTAYVNTI